MKPSLPSRSTSFLLRAAVACGVVLVLAACSSSSSTPSGEAPKKAPAAASSTITFPAITVKPGQEDTKCVVMRLANAAPLHIGAIHNVLGGSSHHLIVYRVNDPEEKREPFACNPFTDTLDPTNGSPLMVTQKQDDLLQLPAGVAFSLDPNQMIRLEMHYLNATASDKTVTATTELIPISDDDFKDEAGFLFIGNPDIRLPPKAEAKLGPTFFEVPEELDGVKFFAMTGHEHRLGTNVEIAAAASKEDPGRMIYDVPNWTWSEPKTEVFPTPVTVTKGGGFTFTCSWNNTTDKTVTFGESANAEMCFFWAYYYPSQGARVCFHTDQIQKPLGRDVCCPGDVYCGLIEEFLSKN